MPFVFFRNCLLCDKLTLNQINICSRCYKEQKMLASTCRSCTRSIRSGFYCSSCRDLTDRNIILLPNGYYLLWRKFKAGSFCAGSTFAKMISKHHKIKKIVINTKNSFFITQI